MKTRMSLAAAILCCSCASVVPLVAGADPWDVRREIREGQREIKRERHEARHEVRREWAENYHHPTRYNRNDRNYGDSRYYGSNYSDAHYHPGGRYCRDGRHIVHLRDGYYRQDRRWYRDGRYWNEYDYVSRYYGGRNRHRDDDDDELLQGIVIGAAVVGVIAAIHEANDND